ncbi:hypothetical protein PtB15_12B464 [Puccinia triticina]|nr:hypothetical protein PtB15_12B464 [Puccinia triticina]
METQPNNPKTLGDIVDRQNEPANSPTNYLSRGHKKDSVASAINGLVGFMDSQRLEQRESCKTNLQLAMELYQDAHAEEASQHEALDAFAIFRDDINAQMFLSIKDKDLRSKWPEKQIDKMHGN